MASQNRRLIKQLAEIYDMKESNVRKVFYKMDCNVNHTRMILNLMKNT